MNHWEREQWLQMCNVSKSMFWNQTTAYLQMKSIFWLVFEIDISKLIHEIDFHIVCSINCIELCPTSRETQNSVLVIVLKLLEVNSDLQSDITSKCGKGKWKFQTGIPSPGTHLTPTRANFQYWKKWKLGESKQHQLKWSVGVINLQGEHNDYCFGQYV